MSANVTNRYKYAVAAIFAVALVMDLLDTTMLNVALPALSAQFGARPATVSWVVTGYLLAIAMTIPLSGWAGDRFGTKAAFAAALCVFTLGSALCATAWSIESLVAFRVLQGLGGGMLATVGMTMVFHAFPQAERAKASAIVSLPVLVAPASGPVLGGYLVQFHGWHWIFLVNVPIGVATMIASLALLRTEKQDDAGSLDVAGLVLSSGGLALVTYALSEAGVHGLGARSVLTTGGAGVAMLTAFVFVEARTKDPLVRLSLFRHRIFTTANVIQFLGQSSAVGTVFLLPMILQFELGLSPSESGLTTFPSAIGIVLTVPIAGKVYRRVGPRALLVVGMAAFTLSTVPLAFIDADTTQWTVRLEMLARGMAWGLVHVPLQTATFATVSKSETGRASAVFSAGRQVAASFGVALVATVLTAVVSAAHTHLGDPGTRDTAITAFHECFTVSTVVAALGAAVALLIRDRDAASTMAPVAVPPLEGELS